MELLGEYLKDSVEDFFNIKPEDISKTPWRFSKRSHVVFIMEIFGRVSDRTLEELFERIKEGISERIPIRFS